LEKGTLNHHKEETCSYKLRAKRPQARSPTLAFRAAEEIQSFLLRHAIPTFTSRVEKLWLWNFERASSRFLFFKDSWFWTLSGLEL